jgi:hypothetical protein
MIELTKDEYNIVKPLLQGKEGYLVPESIIEKNNPGWVFVDSKIDPKIVLIWSHGIEGFYIAGNHISRYSNEINHFIDSYIKPKISSLGITYFEISSIPPVKDIDLQNILGSRNLYSWIQSKYIFKREKIDSLPFDARLYEIKDIFDKKHLLKNVDILENTILSYWESLETYLRKADGFCIVIDDFIVSWAITAWVAGNKHEPRIDTIENFRQKGFAKMCTLAIINKYLKKGYIPYWECEKSNTASAKIAENLGFSKLFDYNCYGFKIIN